MNVAGQLDVLSSEQMQTIHEKACEILSKKGVVFESDETIEIFKSHGFKVDGHTVFFDAREIERCVELAPSQFKLEAPNHEHDVLVGGDRLLRGRSPEKTQPVPKTEQRICFSRVRHSR